MRVLLYFGTAILVGLAWTVVLRAWHLFSPETAYLVGDMFERGEAVALLIAAACITALVMRGTIRECSTLLRTVSGALLATALGAFVFCALLLLPELFRVQTPMRLVEFPLLVLFMGAVGLYHAFFPMVVTLPGMMFAIRMLRRFAGPEPTARPATAAAGSSSSR